MSPGDNKPVLVVGGGIAGITAAVEIAEAGREVILVERNAYLGGRVARMNLYFPKLCPPSCGLEINFKRIKNNPRIKVLTLAEVESLSGQQGNYEAEIKISPRYVTAACTLCGECAKACPGERNDDFNYGLSKTKAAYLPHAMAFPAQYAIARGACPEGCEECSKSCKYGAIRLDQEASKQTVRVSAVITATGWAPYDAAKIGNLGFGRYPNVVTNVIMERLAAVNGPTAGRIVRPTDGKPPASVAFVQCAGSRDENHLPYCSSVCCSASLKQATYVRAACPDAKVTIFYIDIRTPGRLEDFYQKVAADPGIELVKGKAAKVEEDPATGDLMVTAEDTLSGKKTTRNFGMVVLATGMVPQTGGLPAAFPKDEFRFVPGSNGKPGIFGAGCARQPEEVSAVVQDATAAALKAIACGAEVA